MRYTIEWFNFLEFVIWQHFIRDATTTTTKSETLLNLIYLNTIIMFVNDVLLVESMQYHRINKQSIYMFRSNSY